MANITGNSGADILSDTAEADTISGLDGNDTITLSLGGADTVHAGAGLDTLVIDWSALTSAIATTAAPAPSTAGGFNGQYSGGGRSVVYTEVERFEITGGSGGDTIVTGRGNDKLFGGAGDDFLTGGAGHDRLEGGANVDRLTGGTGNDLYIVDLQDTAVEAVGQGIDTAWFVHNGGTVGANIENLVGASGSGQLLVGNILNNIVQGGSSADTIKGAAGDDLLIGAGGADSMEGGAGNDVVLAGTLGANLVVNGSFETVAGSDVAADWVLAGGATAFGTAQRQTATLHGWQKSTGGAFELLAGNGNEQFNTGEGDVVLDMESAAGERQTIYQDIPGLVAGTTLVLSFTAARFVGENNPAALQVFWNGSLVATVTPAGIEMTQHSFVVTAAAGTNRLEFRELDATADGRGTMLDAVSLKPVLAVGDTVKNTLIGDGGDDVLVGDAAGDELFGGAGADVMIGGGGNDGYSVDNAADQVRETADGGRDQVNSWVASYALPEHVEALSGFLNTGQTLIGNDLANFITAGDGADRLEGGGGADLLMGRLGNDTYVLSDTLDTINELADQGSDTIETALAAFSLVGYANVENLTGTGTAGQTLTGSSGANRIQGGAGNDVLIGNGGTDTLAGGNGDDVYHVDSLDDVVEEAPMGGYADEIRTAVGSRTDFSQLYTMPDYIEKFTGTSSTGQGVYFNGRDNLIKMGDGDDLLVLHDGGRDVIDAGGGHDFFYFGNTLDAEDVANGGAGFDTVGLTWGYNYTFSAQNLASIEKLAVYSSGNAATPSNYTLTTVDANVASGQSLMVVALSLAANESLVFNGQAETNGSFNMRGGKGADVLTGGLKNDQIYGNLGADQIKGGGGNDWIEYYSAAESTAAAQDTILDFSAGDRISLSNIDADNNAANGNGKFAFIGGAAFSNVAGQLRVTQAQGGGFLVEGDVDGDGTADLVILVQTLNNHVLGVNDFTL